MFETSTTLDEPAEKPESKFGLSGIAEKMLRRFRLSIGLSEAHDQETSDIETTGDIAEEGQEEIKEFPDNATDINTTEYLGGSSDVMTGYFNGELFVVKKARAVVNEEGTIEHNTDQLIDEFVADSIYESMGFGAPTSRVYENGAYKVAKFIPGKNLETFTEDEQEFGRVKAEIQRGYVLDALLANWDVIGSNNGDNIRIGDDGRVYRIDNGGALRFRARGAAKGETFGTEVGELNTLKEQNPIFSDISEQEIMRQIGELLEARDQIFSAIDAVSVTLDIPNETFDDVRSILAKRLDYLESKLTEHTNRPKHTDRGLYESVTSNNYFDGWDELTMTGNEGLLDSIKQNIMRLEQQNSNYYIEGARELGISVEEFKSILQARAESIISQSNFFRATSISVLDNVMNQDGRWKSQFETSTSDGTLSPKYRSLKENVMFGIPDDIAINTEQRPIYGYFSDEEHGAINEVGSIPPPNNVSQYGRVNFKIKREVALKKATICFADSLGSEDEMTPTPAFKPHFTSFPGRSRYIGGINNINRFNRSSVAFFDSYTEVQYHGQLTMDDIESIHISTKNGLSQDDLDRVKTLFEQYKRTHPESTVELIEF